MLQSSKRPKDIASRGGVKALCTAQLFNSCQRAIHCATFPELLRALADKFRMQPHLALAALAALTASSSVPQVERSASYPKRSSADSALLEWGNSAIIHNADGVVARFGPAATHPEFELGIEADLVTASPRQGCEALSNAAKALTQIVVMYRGGCSFRKKLENAEAAGAAALIVVNNDRRSPDRAFAMSLDADEEVDRPDDGLDPDQDAKIRTPSLMVSYAAGQQLREHGPRRMRIFAGGDRPFIESVTDAAPLLYLVHNAIMDSEIEAAKAKLAPYLLPHPPGRSNEAPIHRATRSLGALRGAQLTAFYDRVASIVGYPVDHLSEPILERRRAGQPYALREDRALLPLNPYCCQRFFPPPRHRADVAIGVGRHRRHIPTQARRRGRARAHDHDGLLLPR